MQKDGSRILKHGREKYEWVFQTDNDHKAKLGMPLNDIKLSEIQINCFILDITKLLLELTNIGQFHEFCQKEWIGSNRDDIVLVM